MSYCHRNVLVFPEIMRPVLGRDVYVLLFYEFLLSIRHKDRVEVLCLLVIDGLDELRGSTQIIRCQKTAKSWSTQQRRRHEGMRQTY